MNIDANVQKTVFALIRKWKLLLIFAIIGGFLGYVYTANFTTLTYTSKVEFLTYAVDPQEEFDNSTALSPDSVRTSYTSKMNYAQKMLPTYIEIFQTYAFNKNIADQLNERVNSKYTAQTVRNATKFEIVEETAMISAIVTTSNPDLSYEIAHQLEISIPEVMESRNSGLVHASVEDKPIKASSAENLGYPKKIAIGAMVGIILASAYVILRNLLDIKIRTEEELIEKYSIPVLGSIPSFEVRSSQIQSSKANKAERS